MSSQVSVGATVLEILSEVLEEPVDDLRKEPVLAAHDWNSLVSLEVLAQLESQLDVVLDLRSFHAVRTVDDLIGLAADMTVPR
jgi:acyl carrier protein